MDGNEKDRECSGEETPGAPGAPAASEDSQKHLSRSDQQPAKADCSSEDESVCESDPVSGTITPSNSESESSGAKSRPETESEFDEILYQELRACAKANAAEREKRVAAWNQKRQDASTPRVKLQGADLRGFNLDGIDLDSAMLRGALLDQASLRGASLRKADLCDASLIQTDLSGANFMDARLSDAEISLLPHRSERVIFRNANLSGAKIRNSVFSDCNFVSASLAGATMVETKFDQCFFLDTDFRCAQTRECQFEKGRDFENVRFDNAVLDRALISDMILVDCSFRAARMQLTKWVDLDIQAMDLSGADCMGDKFSNVDFYGVNLTGTLLDRAELVRYCTLRDMSIGSGTIPQCVFQNGAIEYTTPIHRETSFKSTIFNDTYISMKRDPVDSEEAVRLLSEGIVNNVLFNDPVFGREVRDQAWLNKWIANTRKTWWGAGVDDLWRITSDYGRSMARWALLSVILSLVFGLIYLLNFRIWFETPEMTGKWTVITPFYYSLVTFTTLGFGDITPRIECWDAQIVVAVEVIFGYIMFGGLVSFIANKMLRRNE